MKITGKPLRARLCMVRSGEAEAGSDLSKVWVTVSHGYWHEPVPQSLSAFDKQANPSPLKFCTTGGMEGASVSTASLGSLKGMLRVRRRLMLVVPSPGNNTALVTRRPLRTLAMS